MRQSITAELQDVSKRLFTLHKLALPAILYNSDVLQPGDRKGSTFLGVVMRRQLSEVVPVEYDRC